jgi:hypothetical protein
MINLIKMGEITNRTERNGPTPSTLIIGERWEGRGRWEGQVYNLDVYETAKYKT